MEDALQLANEIRERSGVQLDDGVIARAAGYISSFKARQLKHLARHRQREALHEKYFGGTEDGLNAREDKKHHNDHGHHHRGLDNFAGTENNLFAPPVLIKGLEKLNNFNKDLLTMSAINNKTVRKLNDQIAALKEQLKDGSDNTVKLVADREKFKLDVEDYRRKFFSVLLMSGLSEKDVTHFLQKNPRANDITDEMINIKHEIKKCMPGDSHSKYELMNPVILSKRVEQLEAFNDKLNATSHDRIGDLKDEIHSLKQEHYKVVDDLTSRVQSMSKQLNDNNEVLHLVLIENLKLKDSRVEIEANFGKERRKLLEYLGSNDIDHADTNISRIKSRQTNAELDAVSIKKLQNLLSRTQNDLLRSEIEIESYRNEFLKMEKQVSRANMEKEEFEKLYEETVKKMKENNTVLIKRAEAIDKRRKLEAAGFRSDISGMQRVLSDLQHKINYCLTLRCEKKMLADFGDTDLFRDAVRSYILTEEAQKEIIQTVRTKHKNMENRLRKKTLTGQRQIVKQPIKRSNGPITKAPLKPLVAANPKQQPTGNSYKVKLSKLTTPKGAKPAVVKASSGTSAAITKTALGKQTDVAEQHSGDGKCVEFSRKFTDSKKQRSKGIQCGKSGPSTFQPETFADAEVQEVIELLNPSAPQIKNKLKQKQTEASNDENNNFAATLQQQLDQASQRLDLLKKSERYSKFYDANGNMIKT